MKHTLGFYAKSNSAVICVRMRVSLALSPCMSFTGIDYGASRILGCLLHSWKDSSITCYCHSHDECSGYQEVGDLGSPSVRTVI